MTRRSLVDGINKQPVIDPQKEQDFIHGYQKTTIEEKQLPKANMQANRIPLTTRLRGDYFEALKRESLERQLNRVEPNTIQDFLEEALEPWLKAKGLL